MIKLERKKEENRKKQKKKTKGVCLYLGMTFRLIAKSDFIQQRGFLYLDSKYTKRKHRILRHLARNLR